MTNHIIKVSSRGVTVYHEFEKRSDAETFYSEYEDLEVEIYFFDVTNVNSLNNLLDDSDIIDVFEYCEECEDPLLDEDDIYINLCNECGDSLNINNK
jgi:hypothetical protein